MPQRKSIAAWPAVAGLVMAGLVMAGVIMAMSAPVPVMAQRRHDVPHPPEQHSMQAYRPQPEHHIGEWLRKYQGASPEQQRRALENDPAFRHLPPQRQQKLEERLQRFNSLPPEQQQRVLNRMEVWEHLTPEQKQDARSMFMQMRNLPPQRREMVRDAIRGLRGMPPAERERTINSQSFRSRFTPEERGLLRDATQLPLAPPEPHDRHYVPRPPH